MLENSPSRTAEAVCLMRAMENAQNAKRRVLEDPYAEWFLRPLARAALAYRSATGGLERYADWATDGIVRFVIARHRYIDDALLRALKGKVEQVVILGAGYDMRAYRFAKAIGGRPVFEVDHPATSQRKARVVGRHAHELPAVQVVRVEVDFETQSFRDELRSAGFREGRRTFFVWEGVSMYLTRAAVKSTLSTLAGMSGSGSEVVMDLFYLIDDPDLLSSARRLTANLLALLGEPVTFALHPEDAGPFLERLGFRVREIAEAPLLQKRYLGAKAHIYPANYLIHAVARRPRRMAKSRQ